MKKLAQLNHEEISWEGLKALLLCYTESKKIVAGRTNHSEVFMVTRDTLDGSEYRVMSLSKSFLRGNSWGRTRTLDELLSLLKGWQVFVFEDYVEFAGWIVGEGRGK